MPDRGSVAPPAAGPRGAPAHGAVEPQQHYATHVRFDAFPPPSGVGGIGAGSPQVRFNLHNRSRHLAAHRYEVVLELAATCADGAQPIYTAEVHQAGLFDLATIAEADRARVLNTDGPRALLPLAQQRVGQLIRAGGFPPFDWPAIDFDAVYAQQHHASGPAPLAVLQGFWQAVLHLQGLGAVSPRPTDFRATHAEALAVAQRSRDALPAADAVLATTPRDRATLDTLAAVYSMNEVHRRTIEVYRLAVAARPDDARARYNLAAAMMFNGDLDGAAREIDAGIHLQPTFWDAYTIRAQVRRQTAADNHIEPMLALLHRHGNDAQACERLHMALAREYEDLRDYPAAFRHMAEGNRIGKLRRRYDFRQDAAIFDALAQTAPTRAPAAAGDATGEPIFVFGMPRSGTTLVDRILSSHPQVAAAGELKQFGMLLKVACASPTEDLLDADTIRRSQRLDWRALGRQYLANTRPVTGGTPRFTDKFPHHFLYAGHLANALPNARLICMRRNPMDTCLGNFRQVFSEGSPFHGYACDLADTGHYFARFDRLMAQWQQAFPGRILEVEYESLVAAQETTTRRLLEFCGLPWDPACLAFEHNRAPVATASAVQVRLPLYRDAVQRWKAYAGQLAPLHELLVREGVVLGDG